VNKWDGGLLKPVTQIELEYGINAGVNVRSLADGIVPLQEEHDARLERGIGIEAWMGMDEREKALIVAHRRNRIAIHNLQEEAQIKKSKRDAKRHR
jgi:hypothetical protein